MRRSFFFFCIKLLSSQSDKAFLDQAYLQFHPGAYQIALCHLSENQVLIYLDQQIEE